METKDLIVIGGGINGAGIAADAAGRGLSVLMLEARDLACATSSASSKLIHGGLRYLEHYEFRLVSEALAEREVLLKMAPHIAFPMRFRLPHRPHLRPAWMIRIGLFMYDHLGKRTSLPGSTGLRFGAESVLAGNCARFRIFRLLGRRCPPGAGQRADGRPQRRRGADPHSRHLGKTGERPVGGGSGRYR